MDYTAIMESISNKHDALSTIPAIDVKMIDTTNTTYRNKLGSANLLTLGVCGYFGSFRTSYLQKIEVKGALITLYTRNSMYVFEALNLRELNKAIPEGFNFKLTQDEIHYIETEVLN